MRLHKIMSILNIIKKFIYALIFYICAIIGFVSFLSILICGPYYYYLTRWDTEKVGKRWKYDKQAHYLDGVMRVHIVIRKVKYLRTSETQIFVVQDSTNNKYNIIPPHTLEVNGNIVTSDWLDKYNIE